VAKHGGADAEHPETEEEIPGQVGAQVERVQAGVDPVPRLGTGSVRLHLVGKDERNRVLKALRHRQNAERDDREDKPELVQSSVPLPGDQSVERVSEHDREGRDSEDGPEPQDGLPPGQLDGEVVVPRIACAAKYARPAATPARPPRISNRRWLARSAASAPSTSDSSGAAGKVGGATVVISIPPWDPIWVGAGETR
jgi:hypothetical protein